jgi:hypothetical protein
MSEIESGTSEDFRRIVVLGMMGNVDSLGLLASIFSEYIDVQEALKQPSIQASNTKVKRIEECQLIITPVVLQAIHDWIGKKLEEYQTLYGKIPTYQEFIERAKTIEQAQKDSSTVTSRQENPYQ